MSLIIGVQKQFYLIHGSSLPSYMGEVPYLTNYLVSYVSVHGFGMLHFINGKRWSSVVE